MIAAAAMAAFDGLEVLSSGRRRAGRMSVQDGAPATTGGAPGRRRAR